MGEWTWIYKRSTFEVSLKRFYTLGKIFIFTAFNYVWGLQELPTVRPSLDTCLHVCPPPLFFLNLFLSDHSFFEVTIYVVYFRMVSNVPFSPCSRATCPANFHLSAFILLLCILQPGSPFFLCWKNLL